MKLASLEAIFLSLNEGGVRYLVAGGLAVNAHGYVRYTQDVDLVIALEPANIAMVFERLATLGFRPAVPITSGQFADAGLREQWIRDKGMKVLNFFSDRHRETNVDVFVTVPFDFDSECDGDAGRTPAWLVRGFRLFADADCHEAGGKAPARSRRHQHLRWIMEEKRRDE
jgi:hypothetical protein